MHVKTRYTYSDYRRISERDERHRYELIDGRLEAEAAPGLSHQDWVFNLALRMRTFVKRRRLGKVWISPVDVYFTPYDCVQPDVVFVSRSRLPALASGDKYTKGAPDLLVEAISPGRANEKRDRVKKFRLYERHGVREYWIVDPKARTIEVYLHDGEKYGPPAVYGEGESAKSSVLKGFKAPVAAVFDESW